MFAKHPHIPQEHVAALSSCIRSHQVTENFIAPLYQAALKNLEESTSYDGLLTSRIAADTLTIGTATDLKTGVYVQLSRLNTTKKVFITVGTKWASEQPNPTNSTSTINLW